MKALLLSGGIDSTALAYWVKPDVAVTIDYGQVVAKAEIQAARAICGDLDIQHMVIRIDCSAVAKGALGGLPPSSMSLQPEWWPYRNQLLITFAAGLLIDFAPLEIIIGTVRGDGKAHKDGSKAFLRRINGLLLCQEGAVTVAAPAINMKTGDLLRVSQLPESILGWTVSCNKSLLPCGECRGCRKRAAVLRTSSTQFL